MYTSRSVGWTMLCFARKFARLSKAWWRRDGLTLYEHFIPMKPFIHFGIISVMLMDAMLVYVLTIFCLAQSLQNSLRQVVLIAMFAGGKKQAITPRYGLKWPTNNDRIIQTLYFFECPVWYRLAVHVCNSH